MTGAASWTPTEARARTSSGVVRGVIRSTTLETYVTEVAIHSTRVGSTRSASSATTRETASALLGRLSHGTRVIGPASASRRAAKPATSRAGAVATGAAQVGSQRDDIGENSSVAPVQAAVARPPIAGLGDRGREERDSWRCDDVEPGVVLGGGMDLDEAADHRM